MGSPNHRRQKVFGIGLFFGRPALGVTNIAFLQREHFGKKARGIKTKAVKINATKLYNNAIPKYLKMGTIKIPKKARSTVALAYIRYASKILIMVDLLFFCIFGG